MITTAWSKKLGACVKPKLQPSYKKKVIQIQNSFKLHNWFQSYRYLSKWVLKRGICIGLKFVVVLHATKWEVELNSLGVYEEDGWNAERRSFLLKLPQ